MDYKDIPGTPRASSGFAQVDDKLYWVAGHVGEAHHYEAEHFSNEVHSLDLETGSWTRLADFPVLAQGFRLCSSDGGIFSFGGFTYEGNGEWPVRSSPTVRRYDIDRDIWETVGSLALPRSSNVIGQVGSRVYLIGGWNGNSKPAANTASPWVSKEGTFHETIEVFDLRDCKTVEVLPMGLSPRRAFTAVTLGETITVACGLGPLGFSDLKNEVCTYCTTMGRWEPVFKTPKGLFSPGIAWPGDAPLIIGGLWVAHDHSQAEEFDCISTINPHAGGDWECLRTLCSSRTFPEIAVRNQEMIVMGGFSGMFPVSSVESFSISDLRILKA